jgi:hypothetical protein
MRTNLLNIITTFLSGGGVYLVGILPFLSIFLAGLLELYALICTQYQDKCEVIMLINKVKAIEEKSTFVYITMKLGEVIWGDNIQLEKHPNDLSFVRCITHTILFGPLIVLSLWILANGIFDAETILEAIASGTWLVFALWSIGIHLNIIYRLMLKEKSDTNP